jgi:hypothetical protein
MNGLSTELQERLALNTSASFLELVSNDIIVDDAIRAHRESKKKNTMTLPSNSAPHKYQMVCAPHHHPPQQQQHWATCPPQHQPTAPRPLAPLPNVSHPCLPPSSVRKVSKTCYNCGHVGQYFQDCTAPRLNSVPRF